MPLRYVRSKLTAVNALSVAVATTAITKELADMAQFPPAKAAASLLLVIFQTIQNVQTNRNDCYRLARRCLSLLVDMRDQMDGRWEDAPESLLRNFAKFEQTLEGIRNFMTREADNKWRTRLIRKSTIEEALAEFNLKLDDAARTFQISTLINIQLALGGLSQSSSLHVTVGTEVSDLIDLTSSPVSIAPSMSFSSVEELTDDPEDGLYQRSRSDEFVLVSESVQADIAQSISQAVPAASSDPELELLDHRGFRRYGQSDVRLKGKFRRGTGWWASSARGRVEGKNVLVRTYEGPAGEVAKYRDTLDAALYVGRQLNLSETKTQDYVENTTYVIDDEGKVIMGLPPPNIANWVSWRNFGLAHSIRDIYMRILPNRGLADQPHELSNNKSIELQQKMSHLAVLARALLPDDANTIEVSARLNEIVDAWEDEENENNAVSLQQIRLAALSSKNHVKMWRERTVPAFKYQIGDLGYIPTGKDFSSFCVLQNVVADGLVAFELVQNATGWQGCWDRGFRQNQDLQAFPASFNAYGWAIVVPPGTEQDVQVIHDNCLASPTDGWRFLLDHGRSLAASHNVKPEQLILVTRVGTDQQFKIHDFRQMPFMHPPNSHQNIHQHHHPAFGMHNRPGFGHQQYGHQPHMHNSFMAQQLQPLIFYLFTSPDEANAPYWSEMPMYQPLPKGGQRPDLRGRCVPSIGW
ncbi:hypothetical protein EUX98_g2807 [Antrodiella citrinella]|uniref:Mixed lineage kinase domain-containing protein n=1 Tax=Antrodiella citrinella TaxID=2447956 RepID=A0A4S4MY37_9APHY|nr:hypothetical protein EUX98_g2807 [Antrodiella citrinella]